MWWGWELGTWPCRALHSSTGRPFCSSQGRHRYMCVPGSGEGVAGELEAALPAFALMRFSAEPAYGPGTNNPGYRTSSFLELIFSTASTFSWI